MTTTRRKKSRRRTNLRQNYSRSVILHFTTLTSHQLKKTLLIIHLNSAGGLILGTVGAATTVVGAAVEVEVGGTDPGSVAGIAPNDATAKMKNENEKNKN